jgi:hypothetical protein
MSGLQACGLSPLILRSAAHYSRRKRVDMPKIYEYLGIIILFYSNKHEPIHVHGKYQGQESKAEFIIENGVVVEIIIRSVKGRKSLPPNILNDFSNFVHAYSDQIVQKWIDYFVLHKQVKCEKVGRKVK